MNPLSLFGVSPSVDPSLPMRDPAAPPEPVAGEFGAVFAGSMSLVEAAGPTAEEPTDPDESPSSAAYAAVVAASTLASANIAPLPKPAPPVVATSHEAPTGAATQAVAGALPDRGFPAVDLGVSPGRTRPWDGRAAGEGATTDDAADGEVAAMREVGASMPQPAMPFARALTATPSASASASAAASFTPSSPSVRLSAPSDDHRIAPARARAALAQASLAAAPDAPLAAPPAAPTMLEPPAERIARMPGAATTVTSATKAAVRRAPTMGARVAGTGEALESSEAEATPNGRAADPITAAALDTKPELTVADRGIAGPLTANDDRLTNVNASTPAGGPRHEAGAVGSAHRGGREEAIETAARAADRHALARGVHAEIELGEAGRVHVHASRPDERIHVRLDADAASTARKLGEHARDLALELRTNVHDARVTVAGPNTHASVTSDGSARGDRSEGSGSGAFSGREERPEHTAHDADAQATRAPKRSGASRARFVL